MTFVGERQDPGSWSLFFSKIAELPSEAGQEELLFLMLMCRVAQARVCRPALVED